MNNLSFRLNAFTPVSKNLLLTFSNSTLYTSSPTTTPTWQTTVPYLLPPILRKRLRMVFLLPDRARKVCTMSTSDSRPNSPPLRILFLCRFSNTEIHKHTLVSTTLETAESSWPILVIWTSSVCRTISVRRSLLKRKTRIFSAKPSTRMHQLAARAISRTSTGTTSGTPITSPMRQSIGLP